MRRAGRGLAATILIAGTALAVPQDEGNEPDPAVPEASTPASQSPAGQEPAELNAASVVSVPQQPLRIDRGDERLAISVPVEEHLVYDVVLDVALIGRTRVGSMVLSSGVESFRSGLPKPGQPVEASAKRAGWVRATAKGGYLGYSLQHVIEARMLPQDWPRVIVRDVQSGSENRRRELMYGIRQETPTLWYRRNRHCKGCKRDEHYIEGGLTRRAPHHCAKCKRGEHRVWDAPTLGAIPEGAVDMISAIHLARSLVLSDREEITLPLLDKDRWWDLTMSKGAVETFEVPAGTYTARAIKLSPNPPTGEEREERFKGLFGIHGTLSVWLEEDTGVPVQIEGLVPLGPMTLDVSVELRESKGAPPGFTPAK